MMHIILCVCVCVCTMRGVAFVYRRGSTYLSRFLSLLSLYIKGWLEVEVRTQKKINNMKQCLVDVVFFLKKRMRTRTGHNVCEVVVLANFEFFLARKWQRETRDEFVMTVFSSAAFFLYMWWPGSKEEESSDHHRKRFAFRVRLLSRYPPTFS